MHSFRPQLQVNGQYVLNDEAHEKVSILPMYSLYARINGITQTMIDVRNSLLSRNLYRDTTFIALSFVLLWTSFNAQLVQASISEVVAKKSSPLIVDQPFSMDKSHLSMDVHKILGDQQEINRRVAELNTRERSMLDEQRTFIERESAIKKDEIRIGLISAEIEEKKRALDMREDDIKKKEKQLDWILGQKS